MTKPKYNISSYSKEQGTQIRPSTVEASTVGKRVARPADLTEGRWYAMYTNATSPHTLVRAKYIGTQPNGDHVFRVCEEDYNSIPAVSRELCRTDKSLATGKDMGGGIFHVYKFKSQKAATSPIDPNKSPYKKGQTARSIGAKKGDLFEVVCDEGAFDRGAIVKLYHDDNTHAPRFELVGFGSGPVRREWVNLSRLKPYTGIAPEVNPDVSPYAEGDCCVNHGIKEGDLFRVVNSDGHKHISVGDVLRLTCDDKSSYPYFKRVSDDNSCVVALWRLVPINPPEIPPRPNTVGSTTATLNTVDQFKSEIDALRAKVQQKRDQIEELSKEIAGFTQAIDDTREKLKASLNGYI